MTTESKLVNAAEEVLALTQGLHLPADVEKALDDLFKATREAIAHTNDIKAIVGVCREDNPQDVDEAYGKGTYARLFPTCADETNTVAVKRIYGTARMK